MAGFYIHIPFCERKCVYCDFYSIEDRSSLDGFLQTLVSEIESFAPLAAGETFGTIYFGGGTPSLLEPAQLEKILRTIFNRFAIEAEPEITLEANPGTVTPEKLRGYRSLGVNRLSIGIQSFHEDELRFLGRIHDARQARDAVLDARAAGISNISIDLIFALPGQTVQKLESSLLRGVGLEPNHISAYSLIIEKGTPLYRLVQSKQVTPLPADDDAALYSYTMEFLLARGYEHYEVSNYALPGFRSRHNSSYWNHTPYRGFGPSAHSFWGGKRWWNVASVNAYCERLQRGEPATAGDELLSSDQLLEEAVFLGLRSDGISLQYLIERYGFRMTPRVHELLDQWKKEKLMVQEGSFLRLTSQGYSVCDELCALLLSRDQ